MDFWIDYPSINPTNDNDYSDFPLLAFQAQQFLEEIGWTYCTVWKPATADNPTGLAWSRGDVNESLLPDECGIMGILLQEFYKHCTFLPSGLGMAGQAFASRQIQWASGEEMLLQINFLSSQNRQLPSLELALGLEAHYFKTVVWIPLENGAGVLEIGTTELVPKNDASMIYRILRFMSSQLPTQGTARGEQIMSSSFEAGKKAVPNDAGSQYGDSDEQHKSAATMKIDGGRALFQHPSTTSSYNWSFSSTTSSSSTPSTSDQMGSSNTTFVLNTSPAQVSSMNNEDILLMSPATPKSMVNSFDELHILNRSDHIGMHGFSTPICLPDIHDSFGLNNADLIHFPDDQYLSAEDVGLQELHVPNRGKELLESGYLDPHSEPNTHYNHLLDCVFQPMQCASNARNDAQGDTHHCLNETVRGPSIELNKAWQAEVTSNDHQHQQWRGMFPSINEGERMTDLFGQLEQHMVSAVISNSPLVDSLGDKRLEATYRDQEIMQEQDDKMSNDQGEKMVVPSTGTSTLQAAGCRYVGYASGSARAGKVVGSSGSKAAGSHNVSYASGSAEADKVIGSSQDTGNFGSFEYGSEEAYKIVGSSTSQGAGSYASCSAEAEKVVTSSTVFSSSYGASGLNIGLGRQQDDQYSAPYENFTRSVSPAREHHIHAERKRRSKQGDCINILRNLLPKIPKKDRTTVLESTIQRIEELEGRVRELEQEKNSRQKISSQENGICDYVEDTMPHFQLSLIKNVRDVEANATIIDIMDALQKKNLYCFDTNSQFWMSTSKLYIQILANYKDGENYTPKSDEIQNIKQWWKNLIKD